MTKIVNIKSGASYDVYCGRAGHGQDGYFGNPYWVKTTLATERNTAIASFKQYFYKKIIDDIEFKTKTLGLKDKTLGCFCKPLDCHCDVIVDYLDNNCQCIIAGSRSIDNYELVEVSVKESKFKINEVICGCARGVDNLGNMWADINNIPIVKMPAKWNDFTVTPCHVKTRYDGAKYNTYAGHIRNRKMAEYATHLILIWDGKSSGSASMRKLAVEHNLKIYEKIV